MRNAIDDQFIQQNEIVDPKTFLDNHTIWAGNGNFRIAATQWDLIVNISF